MAPLATLLVAAVLEMGGDAAIRQGLVRSGWEWLVFGCTALIAYGFVVNMDRAVQFGQLMGIYIVVLFVVSQVLSVGFFAERPPPSVILGGLLIVCGGLLVHFGAR